MQLGNLSQLLRELVKSSFKPSLNGSTDWTHAPDGRNLVKIYAPSYRTLHLENLKKWYPQIPFNL